MWSHSYAPIQDVRVDTHTSYSLYQQISLISSPNTSRTSTFLLSCEYSNLLFCWTTKFLHVALISALCSWFIELITDVFLILWKHIWAEYLVILWVNALYHRSFYYTAPCINKYTCIQCCARFHFNYPSLDNLEYPNLYPFKSSTRENLWHESSLLNNLF